jgi:hypothetical protein
MMRRVLMSTWPFHACLAAIFVLSLAWHLAGWHWSLYLAWTLAAVYVAAIMGQGVLLVQAYRRLRASRRQRSVR